MRIVDGLYLRAAMGARRVKEGIGGFMRKKFAGVDGILVTIFLCVIAIVLCIIFRDQIKAFIESVMDSLLKKSESILNDSGTTTLPGGGS